MWGGTLVRLDFKGCMKGEKIRIMKEQKHPLMFVQVLFMLPCGGSDTTIHGSTYACNTGQCIMNVQYCACL